MLLDGKNILITGVLTDDSIAFHVARVAIEAGATTYLTGFGRTRSLTERSAKRLPIAEPPEIFEMDVNDQAQIDAIAAEFRNRGESIDGVLHAIGYAPADCLGGNFLKAEWDDVAVALQTSAYSLKALAAGLLPAMAEGSSIVALDFDATVAWEAYDWMGVSKAALEATARYLARDLGPKGIRVNLVAAGPLKTMAAKSIPGFTAFGDAWRRRAPLGWNESDPVPVAEAVAFLLSDWSRAITGEMLHVDGGYHAMGSDRGSHDE
ncbi:MAG: enoyl-[acyl-carrier-protein] reductase FabI [Acidobacteria bacterium]|nr:MAG: enoyl-[acyl-carrier-protein] reductase FabI [Acidobacteriota bacterium]